MPVTLNAGVRREDGEEEDTHISGGGMTGRRSLGSRWGAPTAARKAAASAITTGLELDGGSDLVRACICYSLHACVFAFSCLSPGPKATFLFEKHRNFIHTHNNYRYTDLDLRSKKIQSNSYD